MEVHHGIISLIPAAVVVLVALLLRKTLEALLLGALVGFILLKGVHFFEPFSAAFLKVMSDETIGWVILVCGFFGSLIQLISQSGGAQAFAQFLLQYVDNRRTSLLATWALGLAIFIDDYLNALAVGSSMRKITDKFGVSREMLAYVVDSTAAPICVIIPISTWAIYVAGILEETGLAAQGEGLSYYISLIPYITYSWIAVIVVPLVIYGIIPLMGEMKKAEKRATETGVLIPPNSEGMTLETDKHPNFPVKPKVINFFLPIGVLIASTIYFDIDAFKGILFTLTFTLIFYSLQKGMKWGALSNSAIEGFKLMLYPLALVVVSFVLKEANDALGLTPYVIDLTRPIMNAQLLPLIVFITMSGVTFATGSIWGVYAIALPIVVPLAQQSGASVELTTAALIGAGAFGSHACFYGDATVLSAAATGCNNLAHALTQLPYAVIAAVLSAISYAVLGFII